MRLSSNWILIIGISLGVVYILTRPQSMIHVTAPTNPGRLYYVKNLPDAKDIAMHLDRLEQHMGGFLKAALQRYPDDPRLQRIQRRWNGELAEVDNEEENIAYSLGKSAIHVCVRQQDGTLAPINSCFFVLAHELAHVCTEEYGHTTTFWNNMTFLLELGEKLGYYTYENHDEEPVMLCGRNLGASPMTCVKNKSCQSQLMFTPN